jgi:hypothetical protein
MDFREALDALCERIDHDDVAKALGVSIQTIRQARMKSGAIAHRSPPEDWKRAVIRLAKRRASQIQRLIERLDDEQAKQRNTRCSVSSDPRHTAN